MIPGINSSLNTVITYPSGLNLSSNTCLLAGLVPWALAVIVANYQPAPTQNISVKTAKVKVAAPVALKPQSNRLPNNNIFYPTVNGSILPSPCQINSGQLLPTTNHESTNFSLAPSIPCSNGQKTQYRNRLVCRTSYLRSSTQSTPSHSFIGDSRGTLPLTWYLAPHFLQKENR